uniref:NrS-1 polymerase-like helicase domain-containing protein n=1 Tax=Chaetophora lobata TaxID=1249516 RepID=A0A7U1G3A5_9CHLO|nr:hypothetical protein [Chaetophora lobata]
MVKPVVAVYYTVAPCLHHICFFYKKEIRKFRFFSKFFFSKNKFLLSCNRVWQELKQLTSKMGKTKQNEKNNEKANTFSFTCTFSPINEETLTLAGKKKYNFLMTSFDRKNLKFIEKNYNNRSFIEALCIPSLDDVEFTLDDICASERAVILNKIWMRLPHAELVVELQAGEEKWFLTEGISQVSSKRLKLQETTKSLVLAYVENWFSDIFGYYVPKGLLERQVLEAFLLKLKGIQLKQQEMEKELEKQTPPVFRLLFENATYFLDSRYGVLVESKILSPAKEFYAGSLPDGTYVKEEDISSLTVEKAEQLLTRASELFVKSPISRFLKILTGNSDSKLMVIRSFMRRCVTAPFDGNIFQSGICFFGEPGTAKTSLLSLFIQMALAHGEIAQSANQFENSRLINKNLWFAPDFKEATAKFAERIRTLLGRDPVRYEVKGKEIFGAFPNIGQIIFISNNAPNLFPRIWTDETLRGKIIPLYLNQEIPEEFMLSNLSDYLDAYIPLLLVWALYIPHVFLEQQVRAKAITNLLAAENLLPKNFVEYPVLNEFAAENLVGCDLEVLKDAPLAQKSVEVQELRKAYKAWCAANGIKQESTGDFIKTLQKVLKQDYNIETRVTKPGQRGTLRKLLLCGVVFSNSTFVTNTEKTTAGSGKVPSTNSAYKNIEILPRFVTPWPNVAPFNFHGFSAKSSFSKMVILDKESLDIQVFDNAQVKLDHQLFSESPDNS